MHTYAQQSLVILKVPNHLGSTAMTEAGVDISDTLLQYYQPTTKCPGSLEEEAIQVVDRQMLFKTLESTQKGIKAFIGLMWLQEGPDQPARASGVRNTQRLLLS
jgi:hypothetical protein